jgi:hypothetical protein
MPLSATASAPGPGRVIIRDGQHTTEAMSALAIEISDPASLARDRRTRGQHPAICRRRRMFEKLRSSYKLDRSIQKDRSSQWRAWATFADYRRRGRSGQPQYANSKERKEENSRCQRHQQTYLRTSSFLSNQHVFASNGDAASSVPAKARPPLPSFLYSSQPTRPRLHRRGSLLRRRFKVA